MAEVVKQDRALGLVTVRLFSGEKELLIMGALLGQELGLNLERVYRLLSVTRCVDDFVSFWDFVFLKN